MDSDAAYPLIRSVSKTGGFDLEIDAAKTLASSISNDDAVKLYVLIRDESHREEREWRDAFLELFPDCESLLPSPDVTDFNPDTLFELIALSAKPGNEMHIDDFESYLMDADDLGLDLSAIAKDGVSLRQFATSHGNNVVLEILDEFRVD